MGEKSANRCFEFRRKLEELLRDHNIGGLTDTSPDILMAYLINCIRNWNLGIGMREKRLENQMAEQGKL
jgi:hypothetical protein